MLDVASQPFGLQRRLQWSLYERRKCDIRGFPPLARHFELPPKLESQTLQLTCTWGLFMMMPVVAKRCYGCTVCRELFCWEEKFDDEHEWLELYYNLQVSMNSKDVEALEENERECGIWATVEDYRAFKNQHRFNFIAQHRKVGLWRHEEYKKRHQPSGSWRQ